MTELLEAVATPRALLLVAGLFGLAPSVLVRVLSWTFPAGDSRRAEMIGELHAVPTWERPIWAAQQLEVAVFEGVPARLRWLVDAERRRAARAAAYRRRAAARGRHAGPPARRALLPSVLLAVAGLAFAGLASVDTRHEPRPAATSPAAEVETVGARLAQPVGVAVISALGVAVGVTSGCAVNVRLARARRVAT